jgi:hypothetical protein
VWATNAKSINTPYIKALNTSKPPQDMEKISGAMSHCILDIVLRSVLQFTYEKLLGGSVDTSDIASRFVCDKSTTNSRWVHFTYVAILEDDVLEYIKSSFDGHFCSTIFAP